MRRLHCAVAILAVMLPGAMFANVTGNNVTVNSGATLSFETGTTSGTQDILFNGTAIQFQGNAKGANLTTLSGGSFSGSSSFNSLVSAGPSTVSSFPQSGASITALTAGTIIVYTTNSAHTGLLLLNTISAGSININFVTFESGTGGGGGPTISQVLNNYGLIPAGFPNSGIAPSTLFIIKGSGLADPSAQAVLQDSTAAGGLPKTLNGASVSVTSGSTTVQPAFYYAIASQLALVLPSNTPVGTATLTVTFNGQTSAPFSFQVVKNAVGIAAYYGAGSGLAHAQDLNYGYYTYTNSIAPGATIRLIGSGSGADGNPARDTKYVTPSGAGDAINALAHVYVGGLEATIVYQGPEGFPGLDEIDVTLPPGVATGCYVSIVGVTAAGVPTNYLTLPIGSGTCQDTGLGFNGSTLTSLSGQTTVNVGFVGVDYLSSPATSGSGTTINTAAFASFQQYSGASYGSGTGSVSIGSCIVSENLTAGGGATGTTTPLNAGTITVSSPNAGFAPVQLMGNSFVPGFYFADLASGFLTVQGGNFPITATAGTTAPAVGAFNTQVTFPTPLLQWTNQAADGTVVRASGVTTTWSGGSPGTYVLITGTSSSGSASGSFTCIAPVAALTFTVPPYVLAALPASNSGTLGVTNYTVPQPFTATGLDYAYAEGFVGYQINAVYQ